MRILILGLILPFFTSAQCYENRLAFNFNIGTPYKSGAELSFFPNDGKIGYGAGFYLFEQNTLVGKGQISQQPEIAPIGRIIVRLNQYGDFKHAVTIFGTPQQLGISYRICYQFGDVLIGIEPTASTKECGVNALVSFDL